MTILDTSIKDIERWRPSRWDQIVGNQALKVYFWDMLWCVRQKGHRSGFNLLLTGPSRGGKTSGVTLGIKALGCFNLNPETLNPCGYCSNCKAKVGLYGNDGWENSVDLFEDEETAKKAVRFLYLPLDCTWLDEEDIDKVVTKVRVDDGNLKIIYLDEIHRLSRRFMDERLLKPLEDCEAIWIASSAYVRKQDDDEGRKRLELEKMFQNRFTYRIETQKPTSAELALWLAERCEEWGIQIEAAENTLCELTKRCHQVPGLALQVLNKAHKRRSRILTRNMVDEHVFDFDE